MGTTSGHQQHIEAAMADPSTSRYVKSRLDHQSNVAITEHENSVTETLFATGSYIIPANTLAAGSVIRMRGLVLVTDNNSTDTLTLLVVIGTAPPTTQDTLATSTAVDVADNDIYTFDTTIIVRTIGSAGTYVSFTHHTTVDATAGAVLNASTVSAAIDTTVAQTVGVTADWSVAHADNEAQIEMFTVEILP